MKRHLGRVANTDQRCVVVFMQIPGRETHALIVGMDNLPERFEQELMGVLESSEGQNATVLGPVLGRKTMSGHNKSIMQIFHECGLLVAMPIDNIVMYPMPNMPFPLRGVLEGMGQTVPTEEMVQTPPTNYADTKFNPYGQTKELESNAQQKGIAAMLMVEAADLQAIADSKREQAYKHDPSLRPQSSDVLKVLTEASAPTEVKAKRKAPAKAKAAE